MRVCRAIQLGTLPYKQAFDMQKELVSALQAGECDDHLLLLQHPHVVSVGRNADGSAVVADAATLERLGVERVDTDRGGDVTYHGPGQLVGYPLLALEPGRRDIRRYVHDLEEVLIRTLSDFGIDAHRHDVHRGVWVGTRKIASLGIRVSRWVTCHGFALNVNTDLSFFSLITPCGIAGCQMTTMAAELARPPEMGEVAELTTRHFSTVFERVMTREPHTIEAAHG